MTTCSRDSLQGFWLPSSLEEWRTDCHVPCCLWFWLYLPFLLSISLSGVMVLPIACTCIGILVWSLLFHGTGSPFFEPWSFLFPCFPLPFLLLFWDRRGPSSSHQVFLSRLHADSVDFNLPMFPFRQFPATSSWVLHSAEYSVGTQQILNNHHSPLKKKRRGRRKKAATLEFCLSK